MRRSSQTTAEERWEDLKHRLIVRAIQLASDSLMEHITTNEAVYWKSTNVVRRNLLMTAVRRSLSNDWNPEGETGSHMRQASFDNLKILAVRRLSDTIANHIRSNPSPSPSPPPP